MNRKLLRYVGRYKKYAFLAPLTVAAEVALEVLIPFIIKHIVDVSIPQGDKRDAVMYGLLAAGMAAVSLVFGALSGVFAARGGTGFAANVRKEAFGRIQSFSFLNIDKFSTASLITRLTTDVNYVQNAFMQIIRVAVRGPVMMISALVMAMIINTTLAIVFVAIIPLVVVVVLILSRFAFPLFTKMFKNYDNMNKSIQENLIAIRTVKSFVREGYEIQKFRDASERVLNSQKKAEKLIIVAMPLMQLAIYLTMFCILWFGGNFVIKGTMSDGAMLSFIQYVNMVLMSLMLTCMVVAMLIMSRASVRRLTEIIDEVPGISDTDADADNALSDGSVRFDNVTFGFGNKPLFENLTVDIKSGETVGIIGGTGSAKTTFINLILRFYDVASGTVKVGGRGVKEYKLKVLRDAVAVVPQKNVLFTGTVKENLLWGKRDATDAEIREAAEIAAADGFITEAGGYEAPVEQGGENFSGGQRQRLCIARALVKRPKIMIMDDSTSAVDTMTDLQIRKALKERLAGTTVIIIAQRLASVVSADKIIVLNEGKIDGVGTHGELLAENTIYKEVYNSQLKGEE